jgi:hypothetical protein
MRSMGYIKKTNSRTLLLAGVSAFAFGLGGAAPVIAADMPVAAPVFTKAPPPMYARTISGTIEAYGGRSWLSGSEIANSSDEANRQWLLGGRGKVDIPFGQGDQFSLQLSLDAEGAFHKPQDASANDINNTYAGGMVAAAHLNYREFDRYLIGMFAGGGKYFVDDTGTTGVSGSLYFAGVEAQGYFGNSTLYGQAGFLGASQPEAHLDNVWFVRGVGRHYFNNGTALLQGELSYARGKYLEVGSPDERASILGWGLRYEQQFKTWANNDGYASWFAEYQGARWKIRDAFDHTVKDHTFLLGLKFAFNQGSLQGNERMGAAVDLPNFGRWAGRAPGAD